MHARLSNHLARPLRCVETPLKGQLDLTHPNVNGCPNSKHTLVMLLEDGPVGLDDACSPRPRSPSQSRSLPRVQLKIKQAAYLVACYDEDARGTSWDFPALAYLITRNMSARFALFELQEVSLGKCLSLMS